MRTLTSSTICLDERARIAGRVDGQLRAHQLDHVGARERGLVDVRGHLRDVRPVKGAARLGAPRIARRIVCVAVEHQAARIGAPLLLERRPRQRFRFGGAGGFLRGRQSARRSVRRRRRPGCLAPIPAVGWSAATRP